MLKKLVVVGGIVAVAGLGVGGAAWAESNSAAPQAAGSTAPAAMAVPAVATVTTPAAPSTGAGAKAGKGAKAAKLKAAKDKRDGLARRLEKVSHAQWVTGRDGKFVTHDAVRGTVAAVGPTSITIRATDGTSEAFTVNGSTKVHVKGIAKSSATIAQVKVGDAVGVLGTGASTKTATQVIDRGTPTAKTAHQKSTRPKTTTQAPSTTTTTLAPTTS